MCEELDEEKDYDDDEEMLPDERKSRSLESISSAR